METRKLKKIIKEIPELLDWPTEQLNFLEQKVLDIKSKWREELSEEDNWLTLGIAISWSNLVREKLKLPELNQSPSEYREIARKHRSRLLSCAKTIANKAQAWGGFWDPENEKTTDDLGWKERKSSIAPHVWVGLKKKGFLPNINSPLDYETASLKGLRNCSLYLLRKNDLSPTLTTLMESHKRLLGDISENAGEITPKQLFYGGYIACDPRLIPQEINKVASGFNKALHKAKKTQRFQDAEIIRNVAFTCAKLLRIHPFESGNKRLIASWALTVLSREIKIPKINKIDFWKELHKTFKDLRKGELAPLCRNLCKAMEIENPENDVPSFWLSPDSVAPNQISSDLWDNTEKAKIHLQLHLHPNANKLAKKKMQHASNNELLYS